MSKRLPTILTLVIAMVCIAYQIGRSEQQDEARSKVALANAPQVFAWGFIQKNRVGPSELAKGGGLLSPIALPGHQVKLEFERPRRDTNYAVLATGTQIPHSLGVEKERTYVTIEARQKKNEVDEGYSFSILCLDDDS